MLLNHDYFAYSSNLNLRQMRRRCPDSQPIDKVILRGYRLVFPRRDMHWRGGVAGIEPAVGLHVEGALYRASGKDLEALDRHEGVCEGEYIRTSVVVEMLDHSNRTALTYLAVVEDESKSFFAPSDRYLDAIIQGARDHDLSYRWIQHLQAFRDFSA